MVSNADHPAHRLAVLDPDFMLGDSTRAARFMLEFQKADEALKAARVETTIVVFGSARVQPGQAVYEAARAFGRLASERGGALCEAGGSHRNVIATGGGPGIMEAANRGAAEAGAITIGLNIALPHEQAPNPYTTPELTLQFHYFAMRKMHLAMRAAALVVFPGGFGTLDELFELLTLRQTGKISAPVPIVLFDRSFWDGLLNLDVLQARGLISPGDLDLLAYADTPEEAWTALLAGGLVV
jgi:uncharacterized protein (TIGR00730 family)